MNDVYLFCYMDSSQEKLIHHFINYYKAFGIPVKNWKIILHGNHSTQLLDSHGIKYDIVNDWSGTLKTRAVNQFIQTINGWLVYADLDEFFDYGNDLESTIKMCNETGTELIVGNFVERTTEDFELKPIFKEEDIFKTFPRDATKEVWKVIPPDQRDTKIMLVKVSDKKPVYKNTHVLTSMDSFVILKERLKVNHFRWSEYAKMSIRKKLYKYLSLNMLEGNGKVYMKLNTIITERNGKYYLDI